MSETTTETTTTAATETAATPPWGSDEDFKPEKAWNLIQNLRKDVTDLKARPVLDDDAKAKLDAFEKSEAANKTELEKANESLTRYQSEVQTWRGAAVGAKVQALAAADFADPTDAVTALADKNYLDAGGQIDEAAIKTDLAALLESKPHYKRPEAAGPRVPAPSAAQGTSGNGAAPTDPASQFAAALEQALSR